MSRPSEKARFYLEQSLSDLRELERKEIFSGDEIAKIVKKRSDFETRINSRAVRPQDFLRYLEWEKNLESLREVRVSRLGVKKQTYYAGRRRLMFIMERATRRFPGELELWLRFVETAKSQNSYKKITQILTSLVRLHSTKPETWTFVASYAMEDLGDVAQARSYMQRGLRFCKDSKYLWLEYFKLELGYLAKLAARRNILGLDEKSSNDAPARDTDNMDSDFVGLPTITAGEWEQEAGTSVTTKIEEVRKLKDTPALTGAIPMAIFDAAMERFDDIDMAESFFAICVPIGEVACAKTVGNHIADRVKQVTPITSAILRVLLGRPLLGIRPSDDSFPQSLGQSLANLNEAIKRQPSPELLCAAVDWIAPFTNDEQDHDIHLVISTVLSRLFGLLRAQDPNGSVSAVVYAELLGKLSHERYKDTISTEAEHGLQIWPSSSVLSPLVADVVAVQ